MKSKHLWPEPPRLVFLPMTECFFEGNSALSGTDDPLSFASYAFLTSPTNGLPQPTDSEEAISDFRAVSPKGLLKTARRLRSMEGRFADWGIFRAIAHEIVGEILSTNSNEIG